VRTAVLDNLWLADLTQMQATYAQSLRADQGGFKVSADSGPMPRIPGAAPIAHGSCNYECKEWLSAMDLQSDQKMGSIAHAFVHALWSCTKRYHGCRCAPDAAVCHGVERCQFKDKDFGQSMDWDASPDALVLSILSPEWEDKPSRRPRFCIGTRSQLYFDLWRKRVRILRMTRTTALVLKILRATY
jgi:hypothetical protein